MMQKKQMKFLKFLWGEKLLREEDLFSLVQNQLKTLMYNYKKTHTKESFYFLSQIFIQFYFCLMNYKNKNMTNKPF